MSSHMTTISRRLVVALLDCLVVVAALIMAGPFLLMLAAPFLLNF